MNRSVAPSRFLRHGAACLLAAAAAVFGASDAHAQETQLLHAMFQDHAVLQRDVPIRLWGRAHPGDEVSVALAGRKARTRADAEGRWELRLAPLKAGGPHVLTARSGGVVQTLDDVLVGDVWLCSGQSNMELQVWRSLDARAEIANAAGDTIRLLTVPQEGSATPLDTFPAPAQWKTVTPDTLRDFSAACFYFARELQKTVDVPMGLINAAWGGSRIQAWTSGEALRTTGDYGDELDVLDLYGRDPVAAVGRWGELWQAWWSGRADGAGDGMPWSPDAPGKGWRAAPKALGPWERWGVPELASFDGMVWYRTTVTLTAAQAATGAALALGPADEIDMTWVNGRAVGSTYGAGAGRDYPLPPGLLREGRNTVVVNVLDTYRDGGLAGPASLHALRFADGSSVPLDGGWTYRVVPPAYGSPPRAPWQTAAGLSTLYNGMIAPLGHYGLRGVLWYQGESNTFEADRYAALLRTLRRDWRARFGDGLPWLVVQLAGYGMPKAQPGESDWAALREAQRNAADGDARTGLVVAIDIGDRYDIHPPNKQELGRRLARAARHVVYGEQVPPSGPVPRQATRAGDAVVLAFADATGDLVALGAARAIGFELCGDARDSCRYADADVQGNRVVLRAPAALQATRVRYCWADGPVCTLFDGAGQPAGPFEIPIPPLIDDDHAR